MRNYPRWIVKIDPDARVHGRLEQFPGEVFGRIESRGTPYFNVQGGFQVFSFAAADKSHSRRWTQDTKTAPPGTALALVTGLFAAGK